MKNIYKYLLGGLVYSAVGFASATPITLLDQNLELPDGYINNFGSGYSYLSQ